VWLGEVPPWQPPEQDTLGQSTPLEHIQVAPAPVSCVRPGGTVFSASSSSGKLVPSCAAAWSPFRRGSVRAGGRCSRVTCSRTPVPRSWSPCERRHRSDRSHRFAIAVPTAQQLTLQRNENCNDFVKGR
jgi:hypothetical protein